MQRLSSRQRSVADESECERFPKRPAGSTPGYGPARGPSITSGFGSLHIDELQLPAQPGDLHHLRAFYGDLLGLPLMADATGAISFEAGASRLTFSPAAAGAAGRYHFAFNIPENQLAAAKAWLGARAPLIVDGNGADEFFFESWNAHACYVYDPAGNIVEFIARHELPNASNEVFGPTGILSLSELGLGAADVAATVPMIQAATGLELYHTALNNSFVPLGDANGLLIVVESQRLWFPDTGVPAGSPPLRVDWSLPNSQSYRLSGPPYRITLAF